MGKNIVVFSDGTNQKGGIGHSTNVYKLFCMVENRTTKQIAFYDPGLGTNWRRVTGSIFGRGFSKNILDCYRFIFENYQAGDQVYLFGFSRGAATVRSLSAFIHLFGILPKSRFDLIKDAFDIYRIKNQNVRNEKATKFIEKHHNMWCKVKFLGVWDTVAALGVPNKFLSLILDKFIPHKFHSFDLSQSVEFARHALSIDDERKIFHPVLWNPIKDNGTLDKMKQVWFCGVHTDVGGGYEEENLSNISLKWMIDEASSKGLRIFEKSTAYQKMLLSDFDINGKMHNEQIGFPGILFTRKQRTWDNETYGTPRIHESVLRRKLNNLNSGNSVYSPWILDFIDKDDDCIEGG